MISYYWIKTSPEEAWEPASRIEYDGVVEWYVCGNEVLIYDPYIVGPQLVPPLDSPQAAE